MLSQIRPGDYVMIGYMGTNGMGSYFKDDFNYYIDACIAMGAKVILNSYSPHGPMGGFESGYNAETNVFEAYRKDSYDEIVREIYEERKDSDTVIGFVDIGKNADASFNAYVDDSMLWRSQSLQRWSVGMPADDRGIQRHSRNSKQSL